VLYEAHADMVWRALRRLGVSGHSLEDAVQDVFVVVHSRLDEFEQRSSVKTWIFGIVLRVASAYRRKRVRREHEVASDDYQLVGTSRDPHEAAQETEAAAIVERILEEFEDDRRSVFVMIELEEFSAQQVAASLGISVNTVHSRLRLARRDFEAGLKRMKAREKWRER
jgi:RNA polymerase sigma-70 factor (ECF subfamily)